MQLKRLGKVLHLSKGGNLMVRLETSNNAGETNLPAVGTDVYDAKLQKIGTVSNVLGPVVAPYVSLTPANTESSSQPGKTVYLREKR